MSETTKLHRGRPVGSGIDDQARLVAIADLLATNPGMKPTTAIRALGITDTSVIRRLRDKFKSVHPEPLAGAAETLPPVTRPQTCASVAETTRPIRISEPVPQPTPHARAASAPSKPSDPPLLALIELAIGTWTTLLKGQLAIAGALLQNPAVRSALSQHIAANELAMSLMKFPVPPRRTA